MRKIHEYGLKKQKHFDSFRYPYPLVVNDTMAID